MIRLNVRFRRAMPWLLLPLPFLALLGAGDEPSGQGAAMPPSARGVQSPHGQLAVDCAQCHATESWHFVAGRGFEHDSTGYALIGAHAKANCDGCHGDLRFGRVASACADCHLDVHTGQLGFDCAGCHTPHDWKPDGGTLALHAARGFPLLGVHAQVDCEACHVGAKGEEFAGTPSDCFACHAADYEATTAPDHAAAGMSTDCLSCHSSVAPGWGDSNFDHDAFFPLSGAHVRLDCAACHQSGFGGQPTSCIGCHQVDFDGTDDPDHQAAGFATDCQSCHSTQTWSPATFNHATTGFALTGAHTSASCLDCHGAGYAGTPTDCYACHQSDFEGTTDPNHVTSGFDTACLACHSTQAWEPATFDHAATAFPLTGAHTSVSCLDCHGAGYAGTPTDCYACHQSDFEGTSDPNHVTSGFDTACLACHSTQAWEPATFDHAATAFPLTGAHTSVSCLDCHSAGYAGTPTDCYACHQADYTGTIDPDHAAAGFNTQCATCHSTADWSPANWDHDQLFPIYSGQHRNEWDTCADCHVQPTDYAVFECIFCHEHSQNETDGHHNDVNDYVYESNACLTCHPDGDQ